MSLFICDKCGYGEVFYGDEFEEPDTLEYETKEEDYKILTSLCCRIEVKLMKKPEPPKKKKR